MVLDYGLYPNTKEEGCWEPRQETCSFSASGLAAVQEVPQGVQGK